MKTLVILFLAVLATSVGESFLSYGMKAIGEPHWADPSLWGGWLAGVAANPHIIAGVFFMAVYFFLYLLALSRADLSYADPLTAGSYVISAFIAKFILREDVSWYRWTGIALITAGIFLILWGGKQLTVPKSERMKEKTKI
ncbi:MAG: DMT family transporter [Nitrospiraceae bacterium]|nr:DMT family transporter [Nitrospiraceae bacterium]